MPALAGTRWKPIMRRASGCATTRTCSSLPSPDDSALTEMRLTTATGCSKSCSSLTLSPPSLKSPHRNVIGELIMSTGELRGKRSLVAMSSIQKPPWHIHTHTHTHKRVKDLESERLSGQPTRFVCAWHAQTS